jgi:capsular polysaccharide biosynthesis protein
MEIKEVLKKIKFYKQELSATSDIQLKTQISSLLSSLVQKRVLSSSNEFYVVSQMIAPRVAHVKEKTKPKRSLILVLAVIMSLMIGVFGAFFKEFLNKNRQDA